MVLDILVGEFEVIIWEQHFLNFKIANAPGRSRKDSAGGGRCRWRGRRRGSLRRGWAGARPQAALAGSGRGEDSAWGFLGAGSGGRCLSITGQFRAKTGAIYQYLCHL